MLILKASSELPFLTSSFPFEKWSRYEANAYYTEPQTEPAKNKVTYIEIDSIRNF